MRSVTAHSIAGSRLSALRYKNLWKGHVVVGAWSQDVMASRNACLIEQVMTIREFRKFCERGLEICKENSNE